MTAPTTAPVGDDDRRCPRCDEPVELTPGRVLRLRHSAADDADAIRALYERLDPDDVRRRFFTGATPPRPFFESWAAIADSGGFGLVAELTEVAERRLVAEAGYAPLSTTGADDRNDRPADGELGIAVDPDFRGWLGPWLLDRLLAHAADRGVANMQAVVLVDNRLMLALAHKRGYATLGHPDWNTVLITMSTTGRVPDWTGRHDRPRVLIESERSRWRGEDALVEAGFDIAVCNNGPCRSNRSCPLLHGATCPLVAGADAIVVDLPEGSEDLTELLRHEQVVHPGLRLVAATDPDLVARPTADLVAELDDLRPRGDDTGTTHD